MNGDALLDRVYGWLARSRTVVRGAVRARGISTAIIGKRLAPSTRAEENGEYELLAELAPSLRVVVDVGANVGDWSARAIAHAPQLERLVCFEPGRWAGDELERRMGADPRVSVVRRALSDRQTTLEFWEEPRGGTMSSGVAGQSARDAASSTLQTATLDEELAALGIERIDFLKVDAEGMDLHVLRGARRLLERQALEAIQFEYGPAWQQAGSTLREAFALLADAGYRTVLLTPSGPREFPLSSTSELYMYANFLALLPDVLRRFEPLQASW